MIRKGTGVTNPGELGVAVSGNKIPVRSSIRSLIKLSATSPTHPARKPERFFTRWDIPAENVETYLCRVDTNIIRIVAEEPLDAVMIWEQLYQRWNPTWGKEPKVNVVRKRLHHLWSKRFIFHDSEGVFHLHEKYHRIILEIIEEEKKAKEAPRCL